MDDYTAYVNPYFVVQKGKFTKHYFEGSSRIVSKLGEGTFVHKNTGIMAGGIDYIRQNAQMQEARDRYIKGSLTPPGPPTQHGIYASPEWTGQPYPSLGWQNIRQDQEPPEGWPRPPKFNEPGDVPGPPVQYGDPITPQTVKAGYGFVDNGIREKNLYFYHPDHLGSSSYITDREGRITQHTEYIAFGEVLFEEHSTSKTMPYLFNGKELDSETNLTYFGARYLDMKTSLWLNTDPLAEKYPETSPYTYTLNNPIKFIDPDGRDVIPSKEFLKSSYASIYKNLMKTNTVYKNILSKYSNSKSFNFYLNLGDGKIPVGAAASTRSTQKISDKKQGNKIIGKTIVGVEAKSYYEESVLTKNNFERSEIAMAGTLIHEALHAKIATTFKKEEHNHDTFMEYHDTYLNALKEYNQDNNLGYTDLQLNDLVWEGSKGSKQFKEYIQKLSKANGNTYEEELKSHNERISKIIWKERKNEEK